MKKIDLIPAMFWMALGIVVVAGSYRLRLGTLSDPGPGLMPFILGIMLSLSSIPIFIRSILVMVRNQGHEDEPLWSGIQFKRLIIVVISLVSYWMFLEKVGFVVMTFFLLLILFKTIDSQKWYKVLFASVLTVFFVFLFFVVILKVELPSGLWRIG